MDSKNEIFDKNLAVENSLFNQAVRAIMSVNFDPALLIDESGKILEMNEAFMDLCSVRTRKIKNATLSHFFNDDRIIRHNFRTQLTAEEPHVPFLTTVKRKGGGNPEVLLKIAILPDEMGVNHGLLVLRDVSGEKRKEEQTSQLAAIVTSSKDAIISSSPDGIIKVWNKSATDIFGYSEAEAIGQHISIIVPNELLEEEHELLARIRNGENLTPYNTIRKRKDGRIINISVVLSPIKDTASNIRGVSMIARETTDQKKFEKELIEARRNAERDKHRAEEAVLAKQQFLTNMSHEIRTPLNAIIGFTRVLLKTSVEEKHREYLNAIKISGEALISLINDILDLGKAEAGKMTFEQIPFNPGEAVSSMLRLFETKLADNNVQMRRDFDPLVPESVLGDPSRLHQIILNLVGNAVKFTREGSIVVKMSLVDDIADDVTLSFSVTDTGIGIAENDQENIFENFSQAASSTSRLYGGTGLGLAIVKQLVFNQGGTVTVNSKQGEGSTFTVNLPYKKNSALPSNSAQEIVTEEVGVIRVLVAEDVTLNQLLMKTVLQSFGFEFEIAANGKIAIEKLQQKKYDIVLMDLHMPEMNGYSATEYIRNTLKMTVPIIALTADVSSKDVERCRAVGMNDFLTKPIDEKLLYGKILKFIDKPSRAGKEDERKNTDDNDGRMIIGKNQLKEQSIVFSEATSQRINSFLEEAPALIANMKQSINNMDWESLANSARALAPVLCLVELTREHEEKARKIAQNALMREESLLINGLVSELEKVCSSAVKELEAKLKTPDNII